MSGPVADFCPVCFERGQRTRLQGFIVTTGQLYCDRCKHVIRIQKQAIAVRQEEPSRAEDAHQVQGSKSKVQTGDVPGA
jgi:hypothetical protein